MRSSIAFVCSVRSKITSGEWRSLRDLGVDQFALYLMHDSPGSNPRRLWLVGDPGAGFEPTVDRGWIRPERVGAPTLARMPGALLEVRGLTIEIVRDGVRYRVIDGVDLTINRGESVAMVGESASGKSLIAMGAIDLLGAGAGVLSGTTVFEGTLLQDLDDADWRFLVGMGIGVLFQDAQSARGTRSTSWATNQVRHSSNTPNSRPRRLCGGCVMLWARSGYPRDDTFRHTCMRCRAVRHSAPCLRRPFFRRLAC